VKGELSYAGVNLIEPPEDRNVDSIRERFPMGTKVRVYWAGDEAWYPGEVDSILSSGELHITYDDGESELYCFR